MSYTCEPGLDWLLADEYVAEVKFHIGIGVAVAKSGDTYYVVHFGGGR